MQAPPNRKKLTQIGFFWEKKKLDWVHAAAAHTHSLIEMRLLVLAFGRFLDDRSLYHSSIISNMKID